MDGISFTQRAAAAIIIYSRLHSMLALEHRIARPAQCSASG
jgi:hypothetical protein